MTNERFTSVPIWLAWTIVLLCLLSFPFGITMVMLNPGNVGLEARWQRPVTIEDGQAEPR